MPPSVPRPRPLSAPSSSRPRLGTHATRRRLGPPARGPGPRPRARHAPSPRRPSSAGAAPAPRWPPPLPSWGPSRPPSDTPAPRPWGAPGLLPPAPTHAGTLGTLPSAWFPRSGRQVSPISPPSKFLCPSHGPRWRSRPLPTWRSSAFHDINRLSCCGGTAETQLQRPAQGVRNPVFIYRTALSAEGPRVWTAVAGDVCTESESPGGERGARPAPGAAPAQSGGSRRGRGRWGVGGPSLPRGVWTPSHPPVVPATRSQAELVASLQIGDVRKTSARVPF